ncbi:hypothetical protein CTI12_AA140050 [Artemisia annua]|uniref:Transducin/WD40 repeat-like superfamily protein n=1 Tax=Artemisia annua TaxID=35608 RepID=A0A2U1PKS9_ARTAN|nr:hypothetical protein CTI12_AA140050 [Artemisia annua]
MSGRGKQHPMARKSAARKGSSLYIYEKDNSRGGDDSPQFHLQNEIHYQKHIIVTLYGAKVAGVDGSTLLVSSLEGTDIRLLEGKSGKRLGNADTNQGKNKMATISPDGQYIAAATLGLPESKVVKTIPIPQDLKNTTRLHYDRLAISPDGKILAVTQKSVLQWLCFKTGEGNITSVTWAPKPILIGDKNVSVLATLGDDKKLKLWTAPPLP